MARAVLLLICFSLSGCYGFNVYGEYLHLSSIPQVDDMNTVDQVGVMVDIPLADHPYATRMEIGLAYELDRNKPVVGRNPVGELKIRQPLYLGTK